ncbi:MAG TPA: hypothetical protein DCY57_10815 [Bacteroidetes bacterium]|nr:hypothetical protein [Bacteroidota bacterium]
MSKVEQTHNHAEGDIVAGDKIEHNVFNSSDSSEMSSWIEKYEEESALPGDLTELIEQLSGLLYPDHLDDQPDLTKKLSAGGLGGDVGHALAMKERFSKRLMAQQHHRAAQQIYLLLLSHARTHFMAYVRPLIESNRPKYEVKAAFFEHVVLPVHKMAEKNPLSLDHTHIEGMVYFLTGNCFLRWD